LQQHIHAGNISLTNPPEACLPACLPHLCSKLELVQALTDLVQVLVLLLRLCLDSSSLLTIPCLSKPMCADTRVGSTAWLALLLLLLLLAALLHGLWVGRAVWFVPGWWRPVGAAEGSSTLVRRHTIKIEAAAC
jgi:hypothetical protein